MYQSEIPKTLYPLTHPQKRIWYIEKLYPGTSLYNLGGYSRIRGKVDFKLLEEAINLFIKKNEGLRLQITMQNGEPWQYVAEYRQQVPDFYDFSSAAHPEREWEQWLENEMKKPFQLENSQLYYIAMFKLDEHDSGFMVKFHHIISDGWSTQIVSEDIYGDYGKLLRGGEVDEEAACSYLEYIESEQKYLASDRFLKNRNYWMEKYRDLPEGFSGRSSEELLGCRVNYWLKKDLSGRIRAFTAENRYSANTFFVALFLVYLYRTTYQKDIILGTPVLNRSGKREKSMFGMFTSTMPLRFRVEGEAGFMRLIMQLNEELKDCYFNQKYPYDLLVQDIGLKKKGYDSLFQICVNYYNTKLHNEINGVQVENEELYNGNQLYSLQLVIKEWSGRGELALSFDYKSDHYSPKQVEDMFLCLKNLAEQVLDNPSLSADRMEVLPESERRRQLYTFNATEASYPSEKSICQMFEEQVERTPDKIALSFESYRLTYLQLNQKANQLARLLRSKGVGRDTITGLMVSHSMEAVIGILGILKAGSAYLPIDPGFPPDRLKYILENSGAGILLTQNAMDYGQWKIGNERPVEVVYLDDEGLYAGDWSNLESINKPGDLAYVIYTSGSTGKPKGVMIEHRSLVNYIWWARKMYVKSGDDVFALYSSLSFDLTVTSIFTPLIGGNQIIIYKDDGPEYVLYRIIKENRATIVKLTPSHLSLLRDMDNRGSVVRCFIVGGEDLKVSLSADIHRRFGGNIEIYNEYGPTETVVGCMIHRYNPDSDIGVAVPVGVPADNVKIYILDRLLKPLPAGCIGEMYISGDGVARGYWNRPELTAERFIPNPFVNGQRMYKTGDLARFLDNGEIECVGRVDYQVKIHGYRIELGEIEKHLMDYDGIGDAVVIDRQNTKDDRYLCAYIVASGEVSVHGIRNYLLKNLPEYMVPLHFVVLEKIPLTSNGKVDRNLLPEPVMKDRDQAQYVAPANDLEKKLVAVVGEVLGAGEIGMKSNFYSYGGDSIKAIQIASRLNEQGLKIRTRDILSRQILEEMVLCLEIDEAHADQSPAIGTFKIAHIYSWFFSQGFREPGYYNQSVVLHLMHELLPEELRCILEALVRHHDSLRLNVSLEKGELYYNNHHLEENIIVPQYDLTSLPAEEQDERMKTLCEEVKSSFDIERGLLFKACLFRLGDRGCRVLLTAHHIVVDGVSWRIILEDIQCLWRQMKSGKPLSLPFKTHSLKAWVEELEKCRASWAVREKAFWDEIEGRNFIFPANPSATEELLENSQTLVSQFSSWETGKLHEATDACRTGIYELLLTALVLAATDYTGNNDVVIELEGHGREEIFKNMNVTRTVGWFTCMYPVLLRKVGNELSAQVKSVKEQLRDLPNNGIGFGVLKYYPGAAVPLSRKYIRFNYLGDFSAMDKNEYFKASYEDSGRDISPLNHMTALVDINAMVVKKELNISLAYSRERFCEKEMESFFQSFEAYLKDMMDFCWGRQAVGPVPSDFNMVKLDEEDMVNLFE